MEIAPNEDGVDELVLRQKSRLTAGGVAHGDGRLAQAEHERSVLRPRCPAVDAMSTAPSVKLAKSGAAREAAVLEYVVLQILARHALRSGDWAAFDTHDVDAARGAARGQPPRRRSPRLRAKSRAATAAPKKKAQRQSTRKKRRRRPSWKNGHQHGSSRRVDLNYRFRRHLLRDRAQKAFVVSIVEEALSEGKVPIFVSGNMGGMKGGSAHLGLEPPSSAKYMVRALRARRVPVVMLSEMCSSKFMGGALTATTGGGGGDGGQAEKKEYRYERLKKERKVQVGPVRTGTPGAQRTRKGRLVKERKEHRLMTLVVAAEANTDGSANRDGKFELHVHRDLNAVMCIALRWFRALGRPALFDAWADSVKIATGRSVDLRKARRDG